MRLLTRQKTSLTIDGKRFVNQELARFLNRIVEGIKSTLGANLSRGNSEGDASEWYGVMSKRSNRQETQVDSS
uniref:Uncharacterized protein n=1 Tax=Vespula pensylvanica TaxID=30213 RepID=A0A834JJ82_VESPE|nr:hypothetical protein H0235_018257 [Vespula pensylvanica]